MATKKTKRETGRLAFKFDGGRPTGEGVFEGYGSVFDVVDCQNDVVVKGAFTESLSAHKAAGTMPKMLWQHNSDEPIGIWSDMEEDSKGLRVKGQLVRGVTQAEDAFLLMKAGALDGLSIGFSLKKHEDDDETGIRKLLAIDLWEVSPVTFPANTEARIADVKTIRDLEGLLRDAGFSRTEAKAIASHGYAGLSRRDTDTIDAEAAAELRLIADMVRRKVH